MINNKAHLFTLMREGATIITPNNRLSQELISRFFSTQGNPVQDKPRCFPYAAFLRTQFKKLCHAYPTISHPTLLSVSQCDYLWRQLLGKDVYLVNDGLLQAVVEAWTRCHLWQLDFTHPAFTSTPQTRQFQQWAMVLLQTLKKIKAITEVQIVNYLLSQKKYAHPEVLVWACFDDYTPQQQALQQYFIGENCPLYHYDLETQSNTAHLYAAKDETDEYQQLLHWITERLAQGEKRIAVVVPDLKTQSKRLQRLLQQQLSPEQFNISFGQSLAEYPLVAHALCWLELDNYQFSVEQTRLLLHSPYLGYAQTEMQARAQLMEESQVLQEPYFEQSAWLKELDRLTPKLAELIRGITTYPEKNSPSDWVITFKKRLAGLGFPGEYPLNSANYQCYQRFLSLFDEFKALHFLTMEMTTTEALSALVHLAQSTIFQPKKMEATVQILGLLEASGCTFNSLWVTGLTDQSLPQNARLSAYIPVSLQREKRMPYACPERELQLAEKTLKRFTNSSNSVVYSYPQFSDDKPNLPSPLIAHLPSLSAAEISKPVTHSLLVHFTESYQIPLAANEKATGGTAILANQAKCPFRAFAEHRLHAKTALETSEGPDAKERGQIIHKIMELLWQTLKTQKALLELNEEELAICIEQAIQQALEPVIAKRNHSFSALFQEVEFSRLKRLVYACLHWERLRPAFEVEALEQEFMIHLSGMDFRVRVDRLDKVEQDKKWVIDYKSSFPQTLPWKEERPKEPQLLLYALLDETINGLLLAQLKAGQFNCKGLSENNHSLPGLTAIKKDENWAEYRIYWRNQLQQLADEFNQGYCPPQPVSASICQQCHFQNLCRFETSS